MYLVLSYDNGQTWGTQNNSIRLINSAWPTNESACSNPSGNDILCFWRVNQIGGTTAYRPYAMLWYFHSPDALSLLHAQPHVTLNFLVERGQGQQ